MTNHYPNEQDAALRQRERDLQRLTTPDNLVRFLKTGRSQRQAGEALGCSGSSIAGWLKEGAVPRTVDLACQHLLGSNACVIRVRCSDMDQALKVMGTLDLLGVPYDQEPR